MAATQPSATPSTPADAPEASLASSTAASEAASSSKDVTDSSKASSISPEEKDLFQKHLLNQCVTRDWIHSSCISSAQQSLERTLKDRHLEAQEYRRVRSAEGRQQWFTPSRLYGQGYNGFGNGHTDGPPRILYPRDKPRPGKKPPTPFRWSRKELKEQSEQHEELVPIRLDVDWDKIKLRDTFTWNLHDRITPIEHFAAQLIDDMGVKQPATQPVYDQVLQQMHEQINDFYPFAFTAEDALDPELPYSAYKNDEMRILIKLNITIGQHTLVDQFEWDISNVDNEPEKFATVMAEELSLSGEFKTAIAHCIREQTQLFTKSLYTIGHPFDGRPVEDADLVSAMLPSPLPSVFRPQQQAKDYGPFLYELSEADLERNEVVFSREQRRQKRSVNRRGGPILPDLKERQRTIRTLLVSSVLPGAATDIEDSRLYKRAAGASRRRGPGVRDGDISDSEDSDDSTPDSPAMSQLQGTARTRNMRGAASAAQQRMANLGRSETPEASVLHHHETRVSSRRHGHLREETEEPQQFVVTLKVSKEKLRRLMQNLKNRRAMSRSETPAAQTHGRAASASTPGVMGPPATPSAPTASSASTILGRMPAPPPPPPGQPPHTPPPPPKWLQDCLTVLCQRSYENDKFEGTMRYSAINTDTDQVVSQPPNPLPKNIAYVWLPRIRCLDCPGKLYNPGPEMTAGNFEVHLKNRGHREKVDARIKSGGKSAIAGSSGAGGGGSGASPAAAVPAP